MLRNNPKSTSIRIIAIEASKSFYFFIQQIVAHDVECFQSENASGESPTDPLWFDKTINQDRAKQEQGTTKKICQGLANLAEQEPRDWIPLLKLAGANTDHGCISIAEASQQPENH